MMATSALQNIPPKYIFVNLGCFCYDAAMASINSQALCFGQKFGHNFKKVVEVCANCGASQSELGGGIQKQKLEYFKKKPEKGIHSEMHALAKEISEYCGEPKKFAMYLGVIKNVGLPRAYKIFSEIKQGKEIKTPGKLFLYMSADEQAKKRLITDNSKKKNKKPLRQGGGRENEQK